jgi:rubrerythrin
MRARLDRQQLILYAVRGEKASFAVYTRAAATARNPQVSRILSQLARDELEHLFTLLKRFAKESPEILGAVDMTMPAPEANQVERLRRARSVEEVLRAAIRQEHESLAGFAQLSDAVDEDARGVLQAIMRRERRHVGGLEALLRRSQARAASSEDDRAH